MRKHLERSKSRSQEAATMIYYTVPQLINIDRTAPQKPYFIVGRITTHLKPWLAVIWVRAWVERSGDAMDRDVTFHVHEMYGLRGDASTVLELQQMCPIHRNLQQLNAC